MTALGPADCEWEMAERDRLPAVRSGERQKIPGHGVILDRVVKASRDVVGGGGVSHQPPKLLIRLVGIDRLGQ